MQRNTYARFIIIDEISKRKQAGPSCWSFERSETAYRDLSRRTKNNPVLVGEPGVGKTIATLAQKIILGEVPETCKKSA